MNTKHTPGPWKFAHGQNDLLTAPDGDDVVAIDVWFSHRSKAEQAANAALIRKAPELLAALQAVWDSGKLNKTMLLGDVDVDPLGKVSGRYLDPLTQQISELLNA